MPDDLKPYTTIDSLAFLRGAPVRDKLGVSGRIKSIQSPDLEISWERKDSPERREESLSIKDTRTRHEIEVHTLDKGWVPLAEVTGGVPFSTRARKILDEIETILERDQAGIEYGKKGTEGDKNPFRNKTVLGPTKGFRGVSDSNSVSKPRVVHKKNHWKCTRQPKQPGYVSVQKCKRINGSGGVAKGKFMWVKIKEKYKDSYNAKYKPWRTNKDGRQRKHLKKSDRFGRGGD